MMPMMDTGMRTEAPPMVRGMRHGAAPPAAGIIARCDEARDPKSRSHDESGHR
jgi:hypothetical protein